MVRRTTPPKTNLDASPILGLCELDGPLSSEAETKGDSLSDSMVRLPPPRLPQQKKQKQRQRQLQEKRKSRSEHVQLRVKIMTSSQLNHSAIPRPAEYAASHLSQTNDENNASPNNTRQQAYLSSIRSSTISTSNSSTTTAVVGMPSSNPYLQSHLTAISEAGIPTNDLSSGRRKKAENRISQISCAHSIQMISPLVRIPSWGKISSINEDAGTNQSNNHSQNHNHNHNHNSSTDTMNESGSAEKRLVFSDISVAVKGTDTVEHLAHLIETEYSRVCKRTTSDGEQRSKDKGKSVDESIVAHSSAPLICAALFKSSEPLLYSCRIGDVLASGDTVTVFNYINCEDDGEADYDNNDEIISLGDGNQAGISQESFGFVPLSSKAKKPSMVDHVREKCYASAYSPSIKNQAHSKCQRRNSDAISVMTLSNIDMSRVDQLVSLAPLKTRFINVLTHPVPLRAFLEFCALPSELALESLLFVLDVERFRHVQPSMARLLANYIYLSYVAPSAPLRINVSSQMRERIPWPFLPGWVYNPWVFDEILASVGFTLKKHTLLRFERSPVGLVALLGNPEFDPEEYITPLQFDLEFDPMVAIVENFEPDIDVIIWVNELEFDPSGTQLITNLTQLSVSFREQLLERIASQFVDVHRAYCLCDGYFRLATHIKPLQKQRRIRKTRKIRHFFGDNPHEALLRQQLMAVVPPSSHKPAARAAAELVARKKNTEAKRRAARSQSRRNSASSSILAEQQLMAIDSDSDIENSHLQGWASKAMQRPPSSKKAQYKARSWSDTSDEGDDDGDSSDSFFKDYSKQPPKQPKLIHVAYNDQALGRALSMIGVSPAESNDGSGTETDLLADKATSTTATPNYSVHFDENVKSPSSPLSLKKPKGAKGRSVHFSSIKKQRSVSLLPNTSAVFERKRRADKLREFFGRSDTKSKASMDFDNLDDTLRSVNSSVVQDSGLGLASVDDCDTALSAEQRNLLVRRRRKLKAMLGEQVGDSMIGLGHQASMANLRGTRSMSICRVDAEGLVDISRAVSLEEVADGSLLTPEYSSSPLSQNSSVGDDISGLVSPVIDTDSEHCSQQVDMRDAQIRQFSKIREVLGESAPAPLLYKHSMDTVRPSTHSACHHLDSVDGSEPISDEQRVRACWRRNKLVSVLGDVPMSVITAYENDLRDDINRTSIASGSDIDEAGAVLPEISSPLPGDSVRSDRRKRVQKLRRFFGQSLHSDALQWKNIASDLKNLSAAIDEELRHGASTPAGASVSSHEFIPLRSPKSAAHAHQQQVLSNQSPWRHLLNKTNMEFAKHNGSANSLVANSLEITQGTRQSGVDENLPMLNRQLASVASEIDVIESGWDEQPQPGLGVQQQKHLDVRITRSSQWLQGVEGVIDSPHACEPVPSDGLPPQPKLQTQLHSQHSQPPLILPDLQQEACEGLDELPRPIRAQFWMTSSPESTASVIPNERLGKRASLLAHLRASKASLIDSIKRASPSSSSLSNSITASRDSSGVSSKSSGLAGSGILRPRSSTLSSQESQKRPTSSASKLTRHKRDQSPSLQPPETPSPRRNFLSRKISKVLSPSSGSIISGTPLKNRLVDKVRGSPRGSPAPSPRDGGSITPLNSLPQISPNNFQASFDRGMALREMAAVAEHIGSGAPGAAGASSLGERAEYPPRARSAARSTRSNRNNTHQQIISSALLASGGYHSKPAVNAADVKRKTSMRGNGSCSNPKSVHWFDSPSTTKITPSSSNSSSSSNVGRTSSLKRQPKQAADADASKPAQAESAQSESADGHPEQSAAGDPRKDIAECRAKSPPPSALPPPLPTHALEQQQQQQEEEPQEQPLTEEQARPVCTSPVLQSTRTSSEMGMSIVLRSPSIKTTALISPVVSPTTCSRSRSASGLGRPSLPINSPTTGPRLALTHKASISAVGGRHSRNSHQQQQQRLSRSVYKHASSSNDRSVKCNSIVTIRGRRSQSFAIQRRLERATYGRKRSYTVGNGRQTLHNAKSDTGDDADSLPVHKKPNRRVKSMIVTQNMFFDVSEHKTRCVTVIPLRIELQRLLLAKLASMGMAPESGQIRIPENTDISRFNELEDFLNNVPNSKTGRPALEMPIPRSLSTSSSKKRRIPQDPFSAFEATRSRSCSSSSFVTAESFHSPAVSCYDANGHYPFVAAAGASGTQNAAVRRRGSCSLSDRPSLYKSTAASGIPAQHKLSRSRSCRALPSAPSPIQAQMGSPARRSSGPGKAERSRAAVQISPNSYQRISLALLSRPPSMPVPGAGTSTRRSLDVRPIHNFNSPYTAMSLRRYASFGNGHARNRQPKI